MINGFGVATSGCDPWAFATPRINNLFLHIQLFFFFGLLIILVLYTGVYRKDFGGNSMLELLFDFVERSIGMSV